MILEFIEIPVEKLKYLNCESIKFLVDIATSGLIMYISKLGGCPSENNRKTHEEEKQ